MPIIEPANPDLLLSQGDILEGVSLFVTQQPWTDKGGGPEKITNRMCIIVSRPCVVGHKGHVIVAAIEKMANNPPKTAQTFEDILNFLTDLRDAPDSPDRFYLGQLPNEEGRFNAKLDSLHTVQIPSESDQAGFRALKRIGHLNDAFVRDLHTRLFRSFATLGFDDIRWLSSKDLEWLASRGQSELLEAQRNLANTQTALSSAKAQGIRNPNEQKNLEKAMTEAQNQLDNLTLRIQPYVDEHKMRSERTRLT